MSRINVDCSTVSSNTVLSDKIEEVYVIQRLQATDEDKHDLKEIVS